MSYFLSSFFVPSKPTNNPPFACAYSIKHLFNARTEETGLKLSSYSYKVALSSRSYSERRLAITVRTPKRNASGEEIDEGPAPSLM